MDLEAILDELEGRLHVLLRARPEGVTELDLMERLAAEGWSWFDGDARAEPEGLFRAHFLLFHVLYRMRAGLRPHGLDVRVHCLDVRLVPMERIAEPRGVAAHDGLAAYYLDRSNLEGMDADAVERLIAEGWARIRRYGERQEALAVLGLEADADPRTVREAYRRLAMHHHPDRGGDTETLQRINEAYRTLTR